MTAKSNDNEPYRESKQHVLSHYFDELLPEAASDNELVSENDAVPDEPVETSKEPVKTPERPPADKPPIDVQQLKQPAQTQAKPKPTVAPAPMADLKPSESLAPLGDQKPLDSGNESAAYQAHKQRLEKMLQQLTPSPLSPLSEPKPKPEPEPKPKPELDVSDAKDTAPENRLATDVAAIDADIEVIDPQALLEQTVPLSSEWLENGRPNWAQEIFDILLIDVNGLKLALPLVALGHIEPIEGDLTPLFGQSEWFLGIQKTPFGNIKTIDTAQYVMPEKTAQNNDTTYKFVVSISGMSWGLAVHSIDQPIAIDPETIRWRVKRENRPWMAGTVKDHMCVLLDIPVMGAILQKEDQNHRNPTGE